MSSTRPPTYYTTIPKDIMSYGEALRWTKLLWPTIVSDDEMLDELLLRWNFKHEYELNKRLEGQCPFFSKLPEDIKDKAIEDVREQMAGNCRQVIDKYLDDAVKDIASKIEEPK